MQAIGAHPEPPALTPGLYTYQRLVGDWPTKLHLRVDPDGGGLLLANAAEAADLSPVGVRMVRGVLEDRSDAEISEEIRRAFGKASAARITADLERVRTLLHDLAEPGDNYPITNLGDLRESDWARSLAAPFRADLVQTEPQTARELLHRLWEAGVPHVTFLARPEAQACNLPLLVEAAEDIGMIAGLRAAGGWLSPEVVERAALAGLDHLDLLYVSPDPKAHDALVGPGDHARTLAAFEQCQELELCPVAQVPLYAGNTGPALVDLFPALQAVGVTNLCFFALACLDDDPASQEAGALPARALPQIALTIQEAAEEAAARYLWAPPVRFAMGHSLSEQMLRGPRTAGDIAVRVEADGRILPPRGPADCAGNLLTDAWEDIWNHACFTRYRERLRGPTRCEDCPDLTICAADCPKDPRGWSDDPGEVEGRQSGVASERAGKATNSARGGEQA